jgi:SAM-dependent methyltransferase
MWGLESYLGKSKIQNPAYYYFQDLSANEYGELLSKVQEHLAGELLQSGPHRKVDWEKGWGDNLRKFRLDFTTDATIPGYFDKSKILRWKQRWIRPMDPKLEQKLLGILVDSLLESFAVDSSTIYEFGCGTGHHLFRVREKFPLKKLIGLDWATSSQKVIEEFAMISRDENLFAANFDLFSPNYDLNIDQNATFLTVASLEQVGSNFHDFVNYILTTKPNIVINIEPMQEFLDSENLLDNLSILYCSKRNYLSGYFDYLVELQRQGKVQIHHSTRSFLGSLYIDGYSIVVWSPREL